MALICHGNGNPNADPHLAGCCWVEGQVCPLRWRVAAGRVYDNTNTDRGTVATAVNARWANSQARSRVTAQLPSTGIACLAALDAVAADSKAVTDRAKLNAAWIAHPEYVALVRPAWARIEEANKLAAGSYNCATWKGSGSGECCHAESVTANLAKQSVLTATAVTVRTEGATVGTVLPLGS